MLHLTNQNTTVTNSIADELAGYSREAKLLESRSLFISEGVSSRTAQKVVSDLLNLDFISHDPIAIYLNSPGGEVTSGFAIYDVIRFIKSPVYIVNAGLCASIATIINVSVPPKRRKSLPNARFLIHQPLIAGQISASASDLEITANEIVKTRQKINEILATECNQSLARVEKDTLRDYWMTAEEAREYGLIHSIITSKSEIFT